MEKSKERSRKKLVKERIAKQKGKCTMQEEK